MSDIRYEHALKIDLNTATLEELETEFERLQKVLNRHVREGNRAAFDAAYENQRRVQIRLMDYRQEHAKISAVADLIIEALCTDGAHHKQWYLEQIAQELNIDPYQHALDRGEEGLTHWEPGIAP